MKKNTENIKAELGISGDGLGLTIEAMFDGMEGLLQSKTVIGEQVMIGDTVILPLLEVSAGMASGAFGNSARRNGAGAMSAKMSPVALLCLQGERIRLINVKNQDAVSKIIDLVPDAIDKITGKRISPETVEKAKEIAGTLGFSVTEEKEEKKEE